MTRKEIQTIIDANPGKGLYLSHTGTCGGIPGRPVFSISFFDPISKTTALRNAKVITKAETGSYISFRPDLEKKYRDRGGILNGDRPIVAFFVEARA